jgi:hypothetical protein
MNAAGTGSGNCTSQTPIVSGNGRFVAFVSCASDLVAPAAELGGTDGFRVFLRDLQTDQTRMVSINSTGAGFAADVWAISNDGRYVVMQSNDVGVTATPDAPGTSDLFVRDTVSNTTQLISINSSGTATGNASSGNSFLVRDIQITPDGRYVLFPSLATDLVTLPHSGGSNLFVRDLQSQTTVAASVNAAGTQLVGALLGGGSISDDGRYVFFASTSAAVTPNDPQTSADVFRRDMQSGTNLLVSVNTAGTGPGNSGSNLVEGSADGRYATFASVASDLSPSADINGALDIYWRDIASGETRLISINAERTRAGNQFSDRPKISGDGQRVLFRSAASDIVAGADSNANFDLFMREVPRDRTVLVSGNIGGTSSGNFPTNEGLLSVDGSRAVFLSNATNLLPNDLNGSAPDIFAFGLVASEGSPAPFDFDGDGKTDVSIFRPSVAEWWIYRS